MREHSSFPFLLSCSPARRNVKIGKSRAVEEEPERATRRVIIRSRELARTEPGPRIKIRTRTRLHFLFIYLKKNKSMEMNQKKKSPKFRLEILRNFLVNKKKNANTTMTCSISGRLIIITSRRAIPKWSWSDWLILVVILKKKKNRRKWFACNLFVRCLSRYKVIFRFVKNCENCCGKFHEFHAASIYIWVEARVWYHFIHATSYGYPLDYLDT